MIRELKRNNNYHLSVAPNGTYIEVVVKGEITTEFAIEFTQAADRLSKKRNITKFLFDVREAENVMDSFSNYNFANKHMEKLQFSRAVKSATLHSPGDHSHHFAETVVNNAGYHTRLFTDPRKAIAWLHK